MKEKGARDPLKEGMALLREKSDVILFDSIG